MMIKSRIILLLFIAAGTILNTLVFNQYIFKERNSGASVVIQQVDKNSFVEKLPPASSSLINTDAADAAQKVIDTTTNAIKLPVSVIQEKIEFNFVQKYPNLLSCQIVDYEKWQNAVNLNDSFVDRVNKDNKPYTVASSAKLQEMRITRGFLVYFPIEKSAEFEPELKWLYRSWIEMQKDEPTHWRTDLVIFIQNTSKILDNSEYFLNKLNCSFKNRRQNKLDRPMCTLIDYEPIKFRNITALHLSNNADELKKQFDDFKSDKFNYEYLLEKVNLFTNVNSSKENSTSVNLFLYFVKKKLSNYGYVDSILMAFDGYDYFKSAGYDFLVRSDMDVFLTPLFAKWAPKYCNDFYVGGGGYSETLNVKRLKRVSKELSLKHANIWNLGSTWYSTPEQFRLVSYLTLFGMGYLSEEEFSPVEREGKLGVMMWPYWHYGVLLLYGQNLAMNHLIGTGQLNIVKLDKLFDVPSGGETSVQEIIHVHVYHGDNLFSKFQFKAGRYDNLTDFSQYQNKTNQVKIYSLMMALQAKFNLMNGDQKNLITYVLDKKN